MADPATGNSNAPAEATAPSVPAIDIEQLTEKVYRLLLADLRLEQARRGGSRSTATRQRSGRL